MHEDAKWLIGLVVFFGLIWLISGGPWKPISHAGPFVKPLAPVGTGQGYGPDVLNVNKKSAGAGQNAGKQDSYTLSAPPSSMTTVYYQNGAAAPGSPAGALANPNASPETGQLTIQSVSYGGGTPSSEYVVISASSRNTAPVELTGLRLESSVTNAGADIGEGVILPFQGEVNVNDPVYLAPGREAYIVTGRSPIGISFQENECTGFFSQFQNFTPGLSSNCPLPRNDVPPETWRTFEDICIDYVDGLSGCQVYPNPPANLSPACRTYVMNEINYNQCVTLHKPDAGFYSGTWRIYLSRDSTLWKTRRENIELLDQNGKIISSYSY